MSKLDILKEEIGWLKVAFGVFVAADLSVVAWVVQNYKTADLVVTASAICTAFALLFAIYRVNKIAFRKMKQLEKL